MFQFRRMVNEEGVLRAAFPEYKAYAARVPIILAAAEGKGRNCRIASAARAEPRRNSSYPKRSMRLRAGANFSGTG